MKTLAQMRNSQLQKLKKKRKLDLSSYAMSSHSKLSKRTESCRRNSKGESAGKKFSKKKESNKGQQRGHSKKQKHEGFRSAQALSSSSKDRGNNEGFQTQDLNRQRRRKKKRTKLVVDEASQLQRRARYLLVKMKLEQNLIEAYLGEGWKGQSREKIKPEKELLRAEKQILKCKLGLRDLIQQLDLLGSDGQIDNSLVAPDGSVHHEHIFCKKCKSQEASEDNDIILCDGTCNCAFHQKCHDPPLATEDIPPEDEGWLCKYCDCKMEILEAINAHLGTIFSIDSTWQDIFKEEAHSSEVGTREFNREEEWPDDESDDNDYNPDGGETDSTGRFSTEDNIANEESSSSSLCCSLESEVFSEGEFSAERNRVTCNLSQVHPNCDSSDHEIVNGPRQRSAVDYRKLYDEMFGEETTIDDLCSEDEDWGPRRRRRREKESNAATTLMTLCESEVAPQSTSVETGKNHLANSKVKKRLSRLPNDVAEKLREAFAENELPSRAFKKKISDLVGLEYEKVDKWFKNARYLALKTRKQEKGASHCSASDKSDSKADKSSGVDVSKSCTSPTSTHKKSRLKKVTWNTNLTTLLSPLKRHRVKKPSCANAKANVELSDNVSLKKHLLHLKAKKRQKKQEKPDNEDLQAQSVGGLFEQLCQAEAKIQKLKHILSTILDPETDESNEPFSKVNVIYVPVAVLKEKAMNL